MSVSGLLGLLVYPLMIAVIWLTPRQIRLAPSGYPDRDYIQTVYYAVIFATAMFVIFLAAVSDVGPKNGVQRWGGRVVVAILSLVLFTFAVMFGSSLWARLTSAAVNSIGTQ